MGKAIIEPAAIAISAVPVDPLLSPSLSVMVGIRETQVARTMPLTKKIAEIAILA